MVLALEDYEALQETVEPAKKLGRYAGYAVGAAAAFALGALFLAIAGARLIIRVLPDGPYWEGLGYVLAAIALGIVIAVIIWLIYFIRDKRKQAGQPLLLTDESLAELVKILKRIAESAEQPKSRQRKRTS